MLVRKGCIYNISIFLSRQTAEATKSFIPTWRSMTGKMGILYKSLSSFPTECVDFSFACQRAVSHYQVDSSKIGGECDIGCKSQVLFSEGFTEIRGRLPFNTLRKTSRSELHPGSHPPQIRSRRSKMLCIYSLQYLLESTVIYSRGALQNK